MTGELSVKTPRELIEEARAHLGAAIAQSVQSDDQIIMDHVRSALRCLEVIR